MESKIKNNLPTDTLKSKQNPIPRGWEIKSIKKLSKTIAGGTPSTSNDEYWGGSIMWMNSGELNLKRVYNTQGRITEIGLKNSSTKLIPRKCVLIGLAGQGKTRGTVALNEVELCTNQSIAVILPSPFFLPDYLYYNLDSRYQELRQLSTGDGGRGGLNLNIINSLKILLPPLSEQKAIAQILSKWDEAISLTQSLITQKEQYKKWLMQNLLTGKKRLKEGINDWQKYKISDLFKQVDRYIKWDENEKYNLVSIRRRNGGLFFREALFGNQIQVKKLKEIKRDDFLISKRQVSHGAWAIVSEKFDNGKVSDEYDCLQLIDENILSASFWRWYCQAPILTHYANVDSNGVHIEKSIFDYNSFKKKTVKIPGTMLEQNTITQILQTADKEIKLLKTKLEHQKKQKKGLMQVLLTGKIRVKTEIN